MLRIGIDTGGTYTDFYAVHAGVVHTHKVPSTPADPGHAVAEGLGALLDRVGIPQKIARKAVEIVYGSTLATNTLLERRGGPTAFVTTHGYADLLEIRRQARPSLYDLNVAAPLPLVSRNHVFGVVEGVDPDGRVALPLTPHAAAALADELALRQVASVSVCLLFAYANPRNEKILARALRARGLLCSISHELLDEPREYERAATTTLNAYLQPVVGPALAKLAKRAGIRRIAVQQSNGGRVGLRTAAAQPVRLLLSGPAGGALGAWRVAQQHGVTRAIAFDMGGTSTDVSVLQNGPPARVLERHIDGLPVRLPMLDIHTVGAGGGSIARRDAGGALQVGPTSAGADPGPACLGRGRAPTVTDAHAVLGRLRPEHYLGGRLQLDVARAARVVGQLAASLRLDLAPTALGILRVVNANMERALRVVTLERGIDPRDFALVSFGGAGGLHAAELCTALGLRGALIPAHASVLSACGLAHAAIERDYSRTLLQPLPVKNLAALYAPLLQRARLEMRRDGITRPRLLRSLDVRYRGQSYELNLPLSRHPEEAFHQAHRQQHGFAATGETVEVVALRLRAVGAVTPPRRQRQRRATGLPNAAAVVEVWFAEGKRARRLRTPCMAFDALPPGQSISGPALLLRDDTTVLVPPGFACRALPGAVWLSRKGAPAFRSAP